MNENATIDLKTITVEDCLDLYHKNYVVEINDGIVVRFKKEK